MAKESKESKSTEPKESKESRSSKSSSSSSFSFSPSSSSSSSSAFERMWSETRERQHSAISGGFSGSGYDTESRESREDSSWSPVVYAPYSVPTARSKRVSIDSGLNKVSSVLDTTAAILDDPMKAGIEFLDKSIGTLAAGGYKVPAGIEKAAVVVSDTMAGISQAKDDWNSKAAPRTALGQSLRNIADQVLGGIPIVGSLAKVALDFVGIIGHGIQDSIKSGYKPPSGGSVSPVGSNDSGSSVALYSGGGGEVGVFSDFVSSVSNVVGKASTAINKVADVANNPAQALVDVLVPNTSKATTVSTDSVIWPEANVVLQGGSGAVSTQKIADPGDGNINQGILDILSQVLTGKSSQPAASGGGVVSDASGKNLLLILGGVAVLMLIMDSRRRWR